MKHLFKHFLRSLFGPDLYQIYPKPLGHSKGYYTKNAIEILSDKIFFLWNLIFGLVRIVWPVCLIYFYRKDSITIENGLLFIRVMVSMMIVLIYFTIIRGIGRFINSDYRIFSNEFLKLKEYPTEENRQKFLSKFDFSLSHWTPDYTISSSSVRKSPLISKTNESFKSTFFERLIDYPTIFLGYFFVNIFGRRLMFPGSLAAIQHMMRQGLLDGRTNLIVSYRAKRCVIKAADGNRIDTVFVDRRSTDLGQKLVITCEGNAGFYEVGCMKTPLDAGCSVLGWNRPGFAESSGYPGVLPEINSIDAVMQYALHKLHFPIHDILIFAWSIGGYSACWTAAHYQDIHGLILDAIFDDVLPLAQRQMPSFLSKFVEKTIRYYLDLNNTPLLKLYHGPFYLIRRTQDEILNLVPGQVQTNRANHILHQILPYRYPFIFNHGDIFLLVDEYLSSKRNQQEFLYTKFCSDTQVLQSKIREFREENSTLSYPCKFGENLSSDQRQSFAIYLIDQYLVNFQSTHCTSLPRNYFFLPHRCV